MRIYQAVLSIVILAYSANIVFAQGGTAFTYQGRLQDAGAPANGTFNVEFRLWDDPAAGNQVGSTNTFNSLPILDGLFTAELDFGASAFDNHDRWLEITVEGVPLVPRQPITRTPYAIQTRGIVVNESGRVAIGTDDPDFPLHVEDDINGAAIFGNSNAFGGSGVLGSGDDGVGGYALGTSGRGVYGVATGTGTTSGVHGLSDSESGRGVFGVANATTGFTYGGRFESNSTGGRGVFGVATASTGTTYGVFGGSESTSGRGVLGIANASTGTTFGVYGLSNSTSGRGVFGEATTGTGITYGGRFESDSKSGRGVFGKANATTGFTYGGRFESNSTTGFGVFGEATASTGTTYGVYGKSNSPSGNGVLGLANASTGITYGVYGINSSTSGRGVFGDATASTGTTYGGRFESDSTSGFAGYFDGRGNDAVYVENTGDGRGIHAVAAADTAVWAQTTTGFAGVHGQNASTTGLAVYGQATANSGTNYGVYGVSDSPNGYDFYAGGAGVNYGASSSRRWKNNVVPISDPLHKLGQLRGVYFDWDDKHGGVHDVGMIAEEVGAVLPEIVQFEDNGIDASGMDYSKMTPLLVEAVKALREEKDAEISVKDAEIAAQAMRLTKLERKNANLSDVSVTLQNRLDSLEQLVEQLASTAKEQPK